MADGWITIGTELSTDKFDKQINELEKKMKKEEEKKLLIGASLKGQKEELEQTKQKVDELADAYHKVKSIQDAMAKGNATPEQFATAQELKETFGTLEQIDSNLNSTLNKQEALTQKVAQTELKYKGITENVSEYKKKIESVKIDKQIADTEKLKDSVKSVESNLQKAVKSVGKMAIALFGVRSIYLGIKRASSDLANYDSEYATNLEYIRYVLTQAIAPVLKGIVQLAMQVLNIINMITNALFGVNLFANGSAESFQKMKQGANGVGKAVKEIKKQLMGFDELNVLTDQSSTGTSVGAGGIGMPDLDLSKVQGETPEWLKWIVDNKDIILAIIGGIGAGLLAIKLGLSGIKSLGIGVLITGIIATIQNLLSYLESPEWSNFGGVIQGIGVAIVGLGVMILNIPVIVAGAIATILGVIASNWEEIKKWFNDAISWIKNLGDNAWNWFFENIDEIQKKFGFLGVGIVTVFVGVFDWLSKIVSGIVELIRDVLDGLFVGVRQIFDGIIQIFQGDFRNGFVGILKGIINVVIGILNGLISGINAIVYPIRSLIVGIGSVLGKSWSIDNIAIPKLPYLKTGGIINMPNKGTLIGGAIAGEAGREGVVPLTDQQAMAELGREIGKNVLINLTNINSMNGRVISRELKIIKSEQDFAYNT